MKITLPRLPTTTDGGATFRRLPTTTDVGATFRGRLKTDADRKLLDGLRGNIGGNFKGLGANVRAAGSSTVTDMQALQQKFKNAQLAQSRTAKSAAPAAPPAVPSSPTVPPGGGTVSKLPASLAGPIAPSIGGPPSMAALARGGEGEMGGGAGVMLNGPSKFRQGIGTRNPPAMNPALAALRHIY